MLVIFKPKAPFSSTYTNITTPVQSHSTHLPLQSTHYAKKQSCLERGGSPITLGLSESNSFVQLFILIVFEVPRIILLFILIRGRLIEANILRVTFIIACTAILRRALAVGPTAWKITPACDSKLGKNSKRRLELVSTHTSRWVYKVLWGEQF